ncbi:MAG: hypothetical protein J1E98_09390 [Lachnospiraceae bacterium]|nr:hypothetical protein [Lachnospiraceae bacterium]
MVNKDSSDNNKNEKKLRHFPDGDSPITGVLLAGIFLVLAGVLIMLFIGSIGKSGATHDASADLQQKITDYAEAQKQNDIVDIPQVTKVEPSNDIDEYEATVSENRTAVVVDEEDENDVSYSKEFILKEMTPYFEDNNLEAVWDLAHLKRYVKLSEGLKGSGTYYYHGDVDSDGIPHGKGLAIYENNTYYYGSWSHGLREGDGRWCRFYINASDKITNNKKYQAHSYAGEWKNDLPNGGGAEHYDVDITKIKPGERIIQNVVGNFTDGLYDDYMFANTVNYTGLVEEWYGIAEKGVFKSWDDIGRRGEYYAWQNKDDDKVYIAIDKVDNSNQGIRELFNQ